MRVRSPGVRRRAVIIGGSIAGSLAAQALADAFDDVVVFERDALAEGVDLRRGVPQAAHTHVVLASGLRALEALFPGIIRDLQTAGALLGDSAADVNWFVEGARAKRAPAGIEGIGVSRPLLERLVRERVAATPNIRIRAAAGPMG